VSFSNSAWNCCRPKEWLEAFHSVFHRNRPSNLPRGAFHNMPGSGETSAFSELYPKVIHRDSKRRTQMARGPRKSRTGKKRMALNNPKTP
jgi:hypothetical protein